MVYAILPSPLCADAMLSLAVTLAVFKAALDSDLKAQKDKEQVSEAINPPNSEANNCGGAGEYLNVHSGGFV